MKSSTEMNENAVRRGGTAKNSPLSTNNLGVNKEKIVQRGGTGMRVLSRGRGRGAVNRGIAARNLSRGRGRGRGVRPLHAPRNPGYGDSNATLSAQNWGNGGIDMSTMNNQTNQKYSPQKRGGRVFRGKKNVQPKPVGLPLVAQGIPHLSLSFKRKDIQSKEKENYASVAPTVNASSEIDSNTSQFGQNTVVTAGSLSSNNQYINSPSNFGGNELNKMSLPMVGTVTSNDNIASHDLRNISSSEQSNQYNEHLNSNTNQNSNVDHPQQISTGNTDSNAEYISVYSNKTTATMQGTDTSTTPFQVQEQSGQFTVPSIVPMQPDIKLVDPLQLEQETEKYYKEMGVIPQAFTASKNQCLTPSQIADITKEYPQVNPEKETNENSEAIKSAWTTLHQYWAHVQENPYDFDGWTYLLNHVETMDNIEAARSAFEGFLPLYPYCFAYWLKFSDLELKFSDLDQALGVLYLGVKCVPFCTDLWVPLIDKFLEYATKENVSDEVVRGLYESALDSVGLSWHSSSIWDVCINYEIGKGDLVRVLNMYRRLLCVPNKLYNKHWDHLLALVRDYHPRNLLTIEEYSNLKKSTCDMLKIKFNPPTLESPTTLLKVTQPEDKIHITIKEKIIASLIPVHERNEKECDKRWKFEEKIKRPYFHVKPLEKKQLKTWREYLNFELKEGDPVHIVSLFERCLVPCAMYEEFWCKYASYMENLVLSVMKGKYSNVNYKPGCFVEKNYNSASETKNGSETADIKVEAKTDSKEEKNTGKKQPPEKEGSETHPDFWNSSEKQVEISPEIKFEVTFLMKRLSEGISVGGRVLNPPVLTPSNILQGLTWEDVRQIYRRGAWIHCPSKPYILMQWAEFEEGQDNVQTAREFLNTVLSKHPNLLKARLQLIELERRNGDMDKVDELYTQAFSIFKETRNRSFLAIKYARFLFKIREEDDKALLILRKVLKKDKGNTHLYHHVFDICYQRRPIDCNGVLASVMLALASKELNLEDKHYFCLKRMEFLKEHGTMAQLKEATAEMEEIKCKLDKGKLFDDEPEESKEAEKKGEIKMEKTHDGKDNENGVKKEGNTNQDDNKKSLDKNSGGNQQKDSKNLLEQSLVPPMQDSKSSIESQERERKIERRRKRREEREEEGLSENRKHKKSKSSRSSSRKDRSSKKSRKSEERRKKRHREEGEINDEDEELEEMVFGSDGVSRFSLKEDQTNVGGIPSGMALPQGISDQQLQQFQQIRQLQQQLLNAQQDVLAVNKPYQTVPPSWDLSVPAMPNYGYGTDSDVMKDGQKALYDRYYELMKQGYESKEQGNAQPMQNLQNVLHHARGNVILGSNNSYLPPPPMPQGILGDSLFTQGKMENLNNMNSKQGNLPSNKFLVPPPLPNSSFITGLLQLPNIPKVPNMPSHMNVLDPLGIRMSSKPINPALLQAQPPNIATGVIEAPQTSTLPMNNDQYMKLHPSNDTQSQSHQDQDVDQRKGILGKYPGNTSYGHSDNGKGSRFRGRLGPPTDKESYNKQSHSGGSANHNKCPPLMSLGLPRQVPMDIDKVSMANVPEWFVNDGGELRISDTPNGVSIIRYWPRYMNEDGHTTLFGSLRKSVKWHQKRYLSGAPPNNKWSALPKMVSWIGPCNYEKDGVMIDANTSWPPEIVDLLHRLMQFSKSSFNSCLMSLYCNGHSHHPWHTEKHKALSKNPTTACVSLGVTRTLEMQGVNGTEYLRIPLFPGSLFVMEGAAHEDWRCQIMKEPNVKAERISLSFRTMLMIKGVTV